MKSRSVSVGDEPEYVSGIAEVGRQRNSPYSELRPIVLQRFLQELKGVRRDRSKAAVDLSARIYVYYQEIRFSNLKKNAIAADTSRTHVRTLELL